MCLVQDERYWFASEIPAGGIIGNRDVNTGTGTYGEGESKHGKVSRLRKLRFVC